jgi:hypothetical protein
VQQPHTAAALALAEAPESRISYGEASGLPHGIFYEGWTAHLRAGTLHLSGGAAQDTAFRAACERLDAAFRGGGPFLDTYVGMAWPADGGRRGGAPLLRHTAGPALHANGRGVAARGAPIPRPACFRTTPPCRSRAASRWR